METSKNNLQNILLSYLLGIINNIGLRIILILIALILLIQFVFVQGYKDIQITNTNIGKFKIEMTKRPQLDAIIRAGESKLVFPSKDRLKNNNDTLSKLNKVALPYNINILHFQEDVLEKLADDNHVTITPSFNPTKEPQSYVFEPLNFNIKISGSSTNVGAYLAVLEQMEHYVVFSHISVWSEGGGNVTANVSGYFLKSMRPALEDKNIEL